LSIHQDKSYMMDFQSHFQYIFRQLNYQRLHAQLCDCVVLVGGQTFQAHRAILAASNEVVTPEAFSTLLDMIYTSTLSLGSSNVMDVLLAASHLHLNAVVKACKLHLSKKNFPSSLTFFIDILECYTICPHHYTTKICPAASFHEFFLMKVYVTQKSAHVCFHFRRSDLPHCSRS
uniref:BTB domain-containing protein n=1 Tax=Periophthalmus magnuspinnatus TaxID=409849 RepID=A0A3B4AXZ7_9GOBI